MKGSSLLDVLIASALFGILFTGMLALAQLALKTVAENKIRTGAVALASEHMEYIRSLNYPSVGVQGGSPNGVVTGTTTKALNGTTYTLITTVVWRDDAIDGISPSDTRPQDYKVVRVRVQWVLGSHQDEVALSSIIANFTQE